jgi:hypothetical protein
MGWGIVVSGLLFRASVPPVLEGPMNLQSRLHDRLDRKERRVYKLALSYLCALGVLCGGYCKGEY